MVHALALRGPHCGASLTELGTQAAVVKRRRMDIVGHVSWSRRGAESHMKTGRLPALILACALAVSCGEKEETPTAEVPAGPAQGSLEWAVAGPWRIDKEKARDQFRHPVETLSFFGVKGSDTVVELWPGGGWYTAILGPYLKAGGGKFYAAHMDPAAAGSVVATYRAAFVDRPEVYGDIELTTLSKSSSGIAPDGSADVVLTFRNVHNWMAGGYADKVFADAFRALKPGGVLGVEEHRLPSARDQDLAARSGYVHESYVIQLAQNAGFVFEESSEINANKKDTADHPLGVWMLPPNLRAPAPGSAEAASYDPEKYKAIGESDRMTLRFRKPAEGAAPSPPPQPGSSPQ
jgi:predicted methyltransferase